LPPRRRCSTRVETALEADVGDEDVAVLLEPNDYRAATAVVIPNLAAAEQRAPRRLAGASLAAGGQADRHGDRLAGLRARRIENRLVGRLLAAVLGTLMLVGVLVAVLDAGVGRTAGLGTAVGLEATRRFDRTTGFELAATNAFRCRAAGISVTTMVAETSVSQRGHGECQNGRKTTERKGTTHDVSLQKKSGSDWGDRGNIFRGRSRDAARSFVQLWHMDGECQKRLFSGVKKVLLAGSRVPEDGSLWFSSDPFREERIALCRRQPAPTAAATHSPPSSHCPRLPSGNRPVGTGMVSSNTPQANKPSGCRHRRMSDPNTGHRTPAK